MVPVATPQATAGPYCMVDVDHRPCLPLPISPPTSEAVNEPVYDIVPGENK